MMRISVFSLIVAAGAGALWVTLGGSEIEKTSADEAKKPPYTIISSLYTLMDHADGVFAELEEKIKEKKFRTVHSSAMVVAELINVGSYDKEFYGKKQWHELSKKTTSELLLLAKEAKAARKSKDGTKAEKHWRAVDAACEACHEKFRD